MLIRTLTVALIAASTLLPAQSYNDSKSHLEVREFSAPGVLSMNLYYHFSNFTADDANVIFAGGSQIFRYEIKTGTVHQVTSGDGVAPYTACPHPKSANLIYYMRGSQVTEIDLATKRERSIGTIPMPHVGGHQQPSFSADLKSLVVSKQRDASTWEIGMMDLATGSYRTVVTQGFRLGHIQHHPTLPLIFYVWETGGYAPQRSWLVKEDGSGNRPFYAATDPKQWVTPLKEWMTHESWIPETGQMTMIMDKIGILIVDVDGKSRLLPGDYWHVHARPDGQFLVADDSKGNLWLIESATDNRRLLASGLRDGVRASHAHASFDHSGQYVLFNTGHTKQVIALIDLKAAGLF
ncbi:hypothetical protein [uncultured Paludibaculum sp.]|uniref:hypothetical protein n=1 Tax=uncultured Paludibaculum sp. TaxID=1765020 RepID=UPI002AAB2C8B|nr:hypothetical protein [uncultured Paludibaculum sp.]